MSDDTDSFLPPPPGLDFAFAIKPRAGPTQDLGPAARGHRRIIDILGGEVHGPRLSGEILSGGADWQIARPDGTIEVLAHDPRRYGPRRYGSQRQVRAGPCAERRRARSQSRDPGEHVQ